jgi:hypothetical protein
MFNTVTGAWNYGQQAHVYACCMVIYSKIYWGNNEEKL